MLALFEGAVPRLRGFDLALIAVYLVAITLFGLRFRGKGVAKDRSLRNYFLADRRCRGGRFRCRLCRQRLRTLTIISIPGVAFAGDFGFLQVVLGYMWGAWWWR